MASTQDQKDEKDQADEATPAHRVWIGDSFQGVVHVHGVHGPGTSVALSAGDEVPAGFEDQVKSHIPTVQRKSKAARLRELNLEFGDDEGAGEDAFDPRDHTIPEVNAYLEEHPQDVQRILDLERQGAARIGIMKRGD